MIFPGIDLLRALAATLVLVYHVIQLGDWSQFAPADIPFVFRYGWVGVDLFLTISGFVITLSALDGVQKQGLGFRPAFARRRLARIVPLYLLTCLVFVVLVSPTLLNLKPGRLASHIVSHLLFVHNLSHKTHGSINGPSWSVALEMQFYLAMFFIAPYLTRIGAMRLLLATLAGSALWRYVTTLVFVPGQADPIVQFIYLTELPGVLDEFAMGIGMAIVVHTGRGPLAQWLRPGWLRFGVWLVLAAALLTGAAWYLNHYAYWQSTAMIVWWRPLLAAGFASLLAAAITFPAAAAPILQPWRYIGQISYGIYLWHMLVILSVVAAVPTLRDLPLLAYVLIATVSLAAFTWHLLEKPCMERFKKAPMRTPREVEQAAPATPVPVARGSVGEGL